MWNRQELKFKGKTALKANYWKSVLVGLIITVIGGGISFGANLNVTNMEDMQASLAEHGVFITGFSLFSIAVTILLINPAMVGCNNFFLQNRKDPTTDLKPLGIAFSNDYGNIVKTMFFTDLFIILWSFLFIIPGIIKSYEYRLVPFILSDNPDMDYKDVLQKSKELMYGSKWQAFILDLSWIGWSILGGLTAGILLIFYVIPYITATEAELYMALAHPDEAKRVGLAVPDAETVEFETTENK